MKVIDIPIMSIFRSHVSKDRRYKKWLKMIFEKSLRGTGVPYLSIALYLVSKLPL
jgi:hypothetical protein